VREGLDGAVVLERLEELEPALLRLNGSR